MSGYGGKIAALITLSLLLPLLAIVSPAGFDLLNVSGCLVFSLMIGYAIFKVFASKDRVNGDAAVVDFGVRAVLYAIAVLVAMAGIREVLLGNSLQGNAILVLAAFFMLVSEQISRYTESHILRVREGRAPSHHMRWAARLQVISNLPPGELQSSILRKCAEESRYLRRSPEDSTSAIDREIDEKIDTLEALAGRNDNLTLNAEADHLLRLFKQREVEINRKFSQV